MLTIQDINERSIFTHVSLRRKNGEHIQVRRTGQTRTWKRDPSKFIVPVKYGLYESFYIANFNGTYKGKSIYNNAHEWA